MGQSYIQAPPDSTGKKVDTNVTATAAQHRQSMVVADPSTDANVATVTSGNALQVDLGATTANTNKLLVTETSASGIKTDTDTIAGAVSSSKMNVNVSSGAVTANAGTNLNTSALALESGGNLATLAGTVGSSKVNVNVANASLAVTPPADITPSTQNITAADSATTSTAQQNGQNAITGSPTANSAATFTVATLETVTIQITGTWSGTIVSEFSIDGGTTYFSRGVHVDGTNYNAGSYTSNVTGEMNAATATQIRIRATAFASGTAIVKLVGSDNVAVTYIANSPQIADGTIPSQKLAINASGQLTLSNTSFAATQTTASSLNATVVGAGTAGSPSGGVVSVQGVSSGTVLPVSLTSTTITGTVAVTESGTWNVGSSSATGSSFPANAFGIGYSGSSGNLTAWPSLSGGDGVNVPVTAGYVYNGSAADRLRSAATASGTSGTGVAASGEMALAATSLPTAVSTAQNVQAMSDKFGRQIVLPNAMRDLVSPMTQLTLTSTTTETSLIAAVASTFLDILSLVVINTSATATQVDFRDSTGGTVRLSLYVPAGDTRGISLTTPMPQAAVNTAWTAKCSTSVASIIITGSYVSNK